MSTDGVLQEWSHESHFVVTSTATSEAYLIETFAPCQEAPVGGFPVLYCLDGNALFRSACDLAKLIANPRKLHPDMRPVLIVAVGYPERKTFHEDRRARDFTPPPTAAQKETSNFVFGGADSFFTFLEHDLKPAVRQRFSIDVGQQCLFGHSLGGLFTFHVYLNYPRSFSKYITASPSLWYNDFELVRLQSEWIACVGDSARAVPPLMITFGALENSGPSKRPAEETQRFREDFSQAFADMNTTREVWVYSHPGEHHITNLFASLPKAVVFASCQSTEACRKLLDGR